MADKLISLNAALDAFGLSEKTRKYGGDHSGYDTRMLYEIQNTLESLPDAGPEWIPCEKELPGIREEVIATDGVFVDCASRRWYPDTDATIWEGSDGWTIDVKAWMPLPEPYKGE